MFDFGTFDQFTFDEDVPSTIVLGIVSTGDDGWKKRKKHYELLLEEVIDAKVADDRALDEAVDASKPIVQLKTLEQRLERSEQRIAEIKAAILRELQRADLDVEEEEAMLLLMSEFSIQQKMDIDDEDVMLLL